MAAFRTKLLLKLGIVDSKHSNIPIWSVFGILCTYKVLYLILFVDVVFMNLDKFEWF